MQTTDLMILDIDELSDSRYYMKCGMSAGDELNIN